MTKGGRSGCLRSILGFGLSGVWGATAAFAIGVIHAPDIDPNYPLANEWYTPFVLFMLMPGGMLIGAVLGTVAINSREAACVTAWACGFAGWALALAVGYLGLAGRGEPIFLFLDGLITCGCVVGGFALGAKRAGKPSHQTHEL